MGRSDAISYTKEKGMESPQAEEAASLIPDYMPLPGLVIQDSLTRSWDLDSWDPRDTPETNVLKPVWRVSESCKQKIPAAL